MPYSLIMGIMRKVVQFMGLLARIILIILLGILAIATVAGVVYLYATSFVDVVLRDSAYNLERFFTLSLDSPVDIFETCKEIVIEQEQIMLRVGNFRWLPRREKEQITAYLAQSKQLVSRQYDLYRKMKVFKDVERSAAVVLQPKVLFDAAQSLIGGSNNYSLTHQHLAEMEKLLMLRLRRGATDTYAVVGRHNPVKHELVATAEEIVRAGSQ